MKKFLILATLWLSSGIALAQEGEGVESTPTILVSADVEVTKLALAAGGAAGYMDPNYIADPTLYDRFVQTAPGWLVSLVPLLVALMLLCRGLSEGLHLVAAKTKTTADDEAANILSRVAEVLGNVLGHVGLGMPKAMILAKAEKIAAKEEANAAGAAL